MKVALDATPLTAETGGIRRYTEELHRWLGEVFREDEFRLVGQGEGWRRWWLVGLPQALVRGGFDVFHGTDFAVPYVPVRPSVMTLHDLSPWRGYPASERVRRRTPWLLRLGLATMVITPTEAVRREAIRQFGLAAERVVAVPLAAATTFRRRGGVRGGKRYFLAVGAMHARKNLEVALAAWREVRRTEEVELWVTGRGTVGEEPGLCQLGVVSDEQLRELYEGCAALLYPSHYEGFGLPVLEAMACGAPVIASRDAAVMETGGGAALYAGAGEPAEWVAAMRAVLAEPERYRDGGIARAAEFSWERTARLTYDVYEEAIARFGR
jgi:glycosyltransferase involved in cell wall biosynthesis